MISRDRNVKCFMPTRNSFFYFMINPIYLNFLQHLAPLLQNSRS